MSDLNIEHLRELCDTGTMMKQEALDTVPELLDEVERLQRIVDRYHEQWRKNLYEIDGQKERIAQLEAAIQDALAGRSVESAYAILKRALAKQGPRKMTNSYEWVCVKCGVAVTIKGRCPFCDKDQGK